MTIRIFIFLALSFAFSNSIRAVTFPYGSSGKIHYDLETGMFDVYEQKVQILKNGYSTVRNHDKWIRSSDYDQNTYSSVILKDGFGTGTKHVILHRGAGLPELKQIFYTYRGLPYFFLEIELNGTALASNQMIPLQGSLLFAATELPGLRTLFVPFDNDTFIRYNAQLLNNNRENASAELSALYNNTSRKGFIMGSVEHQTWKTGVMTSNIKGDVAVAVTAGYTDKQVTRDELAHGKLRGNTIKSPKIFFGQFQDWRVGMESYAKSNRIAEPPLVFKWKKPTPVGWNSWGVMQQHLSLEKAVRVVDFFADSLRAFRSNNVAYIDLDSYWDNMISGGLEGDFSKLKAFADYAKKKGLKPGAYWAPFVDWGYKAGATRRAEGSQYTFGDLWTKTGSGYHDLDGARALDPTHPGTQKRIALLIGKLKECGFEMIKIDFLGHAAVESDHFYDTKVVTGMQAYKAGMECLLKEIDGRMMVYAAISPTMASGRYVHLRRIACDAFKTIQDTEYTLNSVTNGWWQSYLYDYVDADHVVLGDESMDVNIARTLSAVVTGTLISGDDFSAAGPWKQRAKELFQNKGLLEIIKDGKSFIPVEANGGETASEMFVKHRGDYTWLAVFNYGDAAKDFTLNLKRIGLSAEGTYQAVDLIRNTRETLSDNKRISMHQGSAMILKIKNRL